MVQGYGIAFNEWIFDERIKNELRLLIYISSLTAEKGFCYASNEHFAVKFKTTTVTISRQINKLLKFKYLDIEYIKNGNVVKSRHLRLTKMLTAVNKNDNGAVNINVKDNNTSNINIISIDKRKSEFKNSLSFFLNDFDKDLLNDFYSYWTEHNEKGKKMRFEMSKNQPFNVKRRLGTFLKNRNKWKGKNKKPVYIANRQTEQEVETTYNNLAAATKQILKSMQ